MSQRIIIIRTFSSLALVAVLVSAAFASAANTGAGAETQTLAAGTYDNSVRIINPGQGSGSGGLFDINNNVMKDGKKYHMLCIATADHVVLDWGAAGIRVGFEGPLGARFTVDGTGLNSEIISEGGSTGVKDLAYVGLRVDYNSLTAAQNTYLDGLANLNIAAHNLNAGDVLTPYGYGLSGKYTVDALGAKTGFIWRNTYGAPYDYGVHRYIKADVTGVTANYNPGYLGGRYTFDSMRWACSNKANYGTIFPGDSGGIIDGTGDFIGVNTDGVFDTDGTANTAYYQSLYGYAQGGCMFTANDITWLGQNCGRLNAVPEPATYAVFGLGALILIRRRRTPRP